MHYSFQLRELLSLFNINTIFLYFFVSPFLLIPYTSRTGISGSLSYLFSLSTSLYLDLLVRFYELGERRVRVG